MILILATTVSGATFADPPPARPDYIASLPQNEWVFAQALGNGRVACIQHDCVAGFYRPPLLLSVQVGANYVQIVAGLQGCEAVWWNVMPDDQLTGREGAGFLFVEEKVRSLVALAAKGEPSAHCSPVPISPPPTAPLQYLFSPPVEGPGHLRF
ncbi:MAG: hypothetical protein ABI306_09140 [Caulobacteraceae bacterium]